MEVITTPRSDQHGGYEYKFLEPPHSRYVCIICQLPSRDPYMTGNCCRGQILCKPCLERTSSRSTNPSNCPICRKEGFVAYPNWHLDREIKSLLVYCTNNGKGCEWHGELCDVSNHLGNCEGCPFEDVKCSNDCGKILQRQYMANHVENECPNRKSECQRCHVIGEHQFIEGKHQEKCPKVLVPCPNKCDSGIVFREDMEAHRKECPLEMIQCEYYDMGCKVMMVRKNQDKHKEEKMKEHLMMTKLELSSTKAHIADALKRINNLEVLMHLITDKAVAKPTSSATAITSTVNWCDKLAAMAKMFKSGFQICPVVIKLSDISRKERSRNANNFWQSDSFYTHNNGYRLCIRIDISGYKEGKDTYLSVWLHLMEGTHDRELTWPFRGMFRVMVLNQIGDSEHYSEVVVYNENTPDGNANRISGSGDENSIVANGWGVQKFISYKDLHRVSSTCRFLKDDCIFFQVDAYNISA